MTKKEQKLQEQNKQEDTKLLEEYGSYSFLSLCRQIKKLEQEEKESEQWRKEQISLIDKACDQY